MTAGRAQSEGASLPSAAGHVDGAARIVDLIIAGFNTGMRVWGKF